MSFLLVALPLWQQSLVYAMRCMIEAIRLYISYDCQADMVYDRRNEHGGFVIDG